jgi:phosphatidylinositol-3-phosphatase
MNKVVSAGTFCLLLLGYLFVSNLNAAPHRYDHVVIVMEENRTEAQIIGDRVNAPYINTLADGGVVLDTMYGITHPSQPNYIHLFSGDNQGVIDDNLPGNFSLTNSSTYPFKTANLGAEIVAAGFTFAGFCEQLEVAGSTNDWADFDPHTATYPNVAYRRKHNPWANWVAKLSPVPANQLTSTVNRAFIDFPANFANLPTVSFVVPNQQHDMHDGSRKMGDDWLSANLSAYANWAKTNNSLLIITWDEDDYNAVNQIPTVLYGAGLHNGTVVPGTWTHHNMLRTIEDMYGTTTHAGSAAQVRPIVGPFTNDPAVLIQSFRQGLAGYSGALDTQIWQETPTTSYGTNESVIVDLDTSTTITGNQIGQGLVRFNSLFGSGAGQIPTNATIQSAKLLLFTPLNGTNTGYDSADLFRLHRMIVDWNDAATWDSLVGGISADNIEASATATFSLMPIVDGAPAIFDVTSDIELFRSGTPNRGWVIRPSSTGSGNGWTFKSSEFTDSTKRPTLEIVYSVPVTPYTTWAASNNLTGANAAASADPDLDGASNLLEFAYNMNPKVADAFTVATNGVSGLPAAHYLTTSGGILEIEFLRRKGPTAVGLTYTA